nr:MAG TPA: hypothetical protein [Caudoviricetes sp.]
MAYKATFTVSDSLILIKLHENALKKTLALKKCNDFLNTGYHKDQKKCFANHKSNEYEVAAIFFGQNIPKTNLGKAPLIEMFGYDDKASAKKDALDSIKTYLTVFATEKAANTVNENDLVFFIIEKDTYRNFDKTSGEETELTPDDIRKKSKGGSTSVGMTGMATLNDASKDDILDKELDLTALEKFKDMCIGWKIGFSVGQSK